MISVFPRWLEFDASKSALIIGPRRAGKTTFLRQRFPDFSYVTLDDLDVLQWARRDPKGLVAQLGSSAIIDEIQRFPLLTVAAKYEIDNNGALFFMTGSSSAGLLDAAADSMAGRINIYSLPTACWGEEDGPPTHNVFDYTPDLPELKDAMRRLPDAMRFGGFPEVLGAGTPADRIALLANYRNTYFTRDLMQLANLENLEGLAAVFGTVARSTGSLQDASHVAREAGLSYPAARKYLNALAQSQLTFRLVGWQYGPAKRHIKAPKTYFADTGIVTSLNAGVGEGQVLENFVIAEIEKRRKLGLIHADRLCYYRSAGGREIDLVFESDGALFAVEVKATRNPGPRDIANLREFGRALGRPVRMILFHLGEAIDEVDGVRLVPAALLHRGH